MRRAVPKPRIICIACGDRAAGIELATLSNVVAAGGPALVVLCFDCAHELISVCQRSVNAVTNASVNAPSTQGSTQPLTQSKTQANASVNAGFNGCVSGSDLSSDLTLHPAPSEPPDQTRRGVEPKYSAAFEDVWTRCLGKKGNKFPAFRNFQRLKPPVETLVQRWNLWMTTTQWQRGFSKHMEGWLNARGWEDEPTSDHFTTPPAPVPFAVAAEDSRKERAIQAQIDRLRDEQRPRPKPIDPRQEQRDMLAARAAGGAK